MTEFSLHDFPKGYTGRKTYVIVPGMSRMVAKCYTYRGSDGRNRVLPEYGGSDYDAVGEAAMVIGDIQPYWSPVDGSIITSRSAHRDHMRAHGVIEVGNNREGFGKPRNDMPPVGPDIKRAMEELRSRG